MFEILVLGSVWTVTIMSEEDYVDRFGDSDAAHVFPGIREMYFNEEELAKDVVKHECFHAYIKETCTSSANLTGEQVEEVAAELYALHSSKIDKTAKALYKELKRIKDEG